MRGLMMERPLLLQQLIDTAERAHASATIVSREQDGSIFRYDYGRACRRIRLVANALLKLGVGPGDRVATLAWNTHRHFELYFAISGIGAVCHTINPRLAQDDLRYVANHAGDSLLFFDGSFAASACDLATHSPGIRHFIAMSSPSCAVDSLDYEKLVADAEPLAEWPDFDEHEAAVLCYTSGTTGKPKGVLYSHRALVLHTLASCAPDLLGMSACETILPIVPLYHVNAWGAPYAATMVGARLVFPGQYLDPQPIYELLQSERVTVALGVPTVWLRLLDWCQEAGVRLEYPARAIIGGAALTGSLIDRLETDHQIEVRHGWGMTEMSPIGTINALKPKQAACDVSQRRVFQLKQGRFPHGCEARLVSDEGAPLSPAAVTSGRLQVRGPWVASAYYEDPTPLLTSDGWFDTGDIATLDDEGYMQIVDRAKDLIKSGGEWISSLVLENAAASFGGVSMVAAIGVPDPLWQERPVLYVVKRGAQPIDGNALRQHLAALLPKWALPDQIVFIDALPMGSTGKVQKSILRGLYAKARASEA